MSLHQTLAPFLYPIRPGFRGPCNIVRERLGHVRARGRKRITTAATTSESSNSEIRLPIPPPGTTKHSALQPPTSDTFSTTQSTPSSSSVTLSPTPPDSLIPSDTHNISGSEISRDLEQASYSTSSFTDLLTLSLLSGPGGHGCTSFLREKFISAGPPNGGDGGQGGSIYIAPSASLSSLASLARRPHIRAGRGRNGQGKTQSGSRGEDVLLTVPVGTVVTELSRYDPFEEEELARKLARSGTFAPDSDMAGAASAREKDPRRKFLLHPSAPLSEYATTEFPNLHRERRMGTTQPAAPILLDLSDPNAKPVLLVAGAVGGLGNPHFITREMTRPRFATKGGEGMRLQLKLELKLLADVGLVGMPNAGKSTLLRAVTRSRARVGGWAFTTLAPNVGTVVLDDFQGPKQRSAQGLLERFTIADIPGLVEDAHLDKGLGLGFLRHVERARVLAFVVDLSEGDARERLRGLWREVRMYEQMKQQHFQEEEDGRIVDWTPGAPAKKSSTRGAQNTLINEESFLARDDIIHIESGATVGISSKPWFVVATKADLPETRENFERLRHWLNEEGARPHLEDMEDDGVGSEKRKKKRSEGHGWKGSIAVIPISAIEAANIRDRDGVGDIAGTIAGTGGGVERVVEWILKLLSG